LALKSRLAPVFERYASAKQRVEGYQNRIIPKAEETVSLVRTTYELGEVNFDTVLQTQRTYAQTRLAYIDALEQLRLAEAEIDGLLLSGSLAPAL
jgi:cobalt-zinc-cadmium efflux system outer membrane protein